MKPICSIIMIFLMVLSMSCTSRPPVRASTAEDQARSFERAIREVKKNSVLINKHFEPREAIITGSGYSGVKEITVKGEMLINGKKFAVFYNFADAYQTKDNHYVIPFSLQDTANNITHNDELLWSPAGENAGLLLSFDDDFFDVWSEYFDLFDAYNAKVTFFVQGSPAQKDEAGDTVSDAVKDPGQFCAMVRDRGHGLGFHTASHLDLRKISREKFYEETIEAAALFFKNGISFCSLAYPFGFSEQWMRDVLALVFPVTRGYGSNIRFCDTSVSSDGYIVSKAIDNIIYPEDEKFEHDILRILLAAKFTGNSVVPFTTHDISDEADWGIKITRLEYLLKTTSDLKMKFYTYGDFPALFPRIGSLNGSPER